VAKGGLTILLICSGVGGGLAGDCTLKGGVVGRSMFEVGGKMMDVQNISKRGCEGLPLQTAASA
jgi:hypothetical protein